MPVRRRYGKKRAYTKRKPTARKTRRTTRKSKSGTGTKSFPRKSLIMRSRVPMQLRRAANRTQILRAWSYDAIGTDTTSVLNNYLFLASPNSSVGTLGEPGLYIARLSWKMMDLPTATKTELLNWDYCKPMCCTWTFTFPFHLTIGASTTTGTAPMENTIYSAGASGYAPIEYWWYYDWDTDEEAAGGTIVNGELPTSNGIIPTAYYTALREFQQRTGVHHGWISASRPTIKFTLAPGRVLTPVITESTGAGHTGLDWCPGFSCTPGWMPNRAGPAESMIMRGIRICFRANNSFPLNPTFALSRVAPATWQMLGVQVQKEMFIAVKAKKDPGEMP